MHVGSHVMSCGASSYKLPAVLKDKPFLSIGHLFAGICANSRHCPQPAAACPFCGAHCGKYGGPGSHPLHHHACHWTADTHHDFHAGRAASRQWPSLQALQHQACLHQRQ